MELTEVKKELVETKKQERAKSTTKELSSSAEMKAVPEEKYCKLEADFDQALAVSCLFAQTLCLLHPPTCASAVLHNYRCMRINIGAFFILTCPYYGAGTSRGDATTDSSLQF